MNPSCALVLVLASLVPSTGGFSSIANASAPPLRLEEPEKVGSAQLVSEQDTTLGLVHGHLAIRGGSVQEPGNQKGVATLLARLLVPDDLSSWLKSRGGSIEPSVDLDAIRFAFTCAPADFEETIGRLAASLKSNDYPTERVASTREALVREQEVEQSTVSSIADRAAEHIFYGRFPDYTTTPNLDHLRSLTATDVQAFHSANVGANRLVCAVVSSLSRNDVKAALKKALDGLGKVEAVPTELPKPLYTPLLAKIYVVDVPGADHTEVRVISPGVSRNSITQPALESWKWSANGGPESRIQKEVVATGLATSAECGFESDWNRMGLFRGTLSATHENVGEALQAYMTVIQEQRAGRVTRPDLEEGRLRFAEWEALQLEDPAVRAYRLAQTTIHRFPANYYELYAKATEEIRGNYVIKALRGNLMVRSMVIVAAGPAEKITENLQYYTDTIEYTFATPASDPEAVALTNRMLEALGGRELWANLKGAELVAETKVEQSGIWRTRTAHLWRYFDKVYSRVEQSARNKEVCVTDGTPGWITGDLGVRFTSNSRYRVQVANTRRWLYSLLHQLSVEDSVIVSRMGEDGQIVFSDRIGEICSIELAENGRPARMSYTDTAGDQVAIYKTWSKSGDYLYCNELTIPYSNLKTDAEYTQKVTKFVPNPPFDPALYKMPASE